MASVIMLLECLTNGNVKCKKTKEFQIYGQKDHKIIIMMSKTLKTNHRFRIYTYGANQMKKKK